MGGQAARGAHDGIDLRGSIKTYSGRLHETAPQRTGGEHRSRKDRAPVDCAFVPVGSLIYVRAQHVLQDAADERARLGEVVDRDIATFNKLVEDQHIPAVAAWSLPRRRG